MARGSEVDALKINERMQEEVYDDADVGRATGPQRRADDSIEPMLAGQRGSTVRKSPSMRGTADGKKVALALEVQKTKDVDSLERPVSSGKKRN